MYIAGYKNIIRNIYRQVLCTPLYQQTNSMHALVLQKILDSSCFSVSSYGYLPEERPINNRSHSSKYHNAQEVICGYYVISHFHA
jgi:hypothetical protein